MTALATNLRAALDRLGLTVTAAAALSGVHRVTFQHYHGGRRTPSLSALEKLAAALKTTPDKLLKAPRQKARP